MNVPGKSSLLRVAVLVALAAAMSVKPAKIDAAVKSDTGSDAVATSKPVGTVLGRRLPDFILPNAAGKATAFSDFNDAKHVVVVFLGTQCPIGNAYVPVLNDLQKRYANKGVQVVAINFVFLSQQNNRPVLRFRQYK